MSKKINEKTDFYYPILIFLLALTIRLIYFSEYRNSPIFEYPQVDAQTYVTLAQKIVSGEFFKTNALSFYQPPLYPFLLALFFKIFSSQLFWVHLLQFVLGAVNCGLIYRIGHRCFNEKVGSVAGILAAVYWPLIYFDGEMLLPTLFIFLNLCLLICLLAYLKNLASGAIILAGLVLGLSAITRPNILIFGWIVCPVLIFWVTPFSKSWKPVGLFFLSSILFILPVTLYNYQMDRAFVLISHNGGINFYIGNSPPEARLIDIRPGEAWEAFTATPRRENLAKEFTGADFSQYWYQKSWHYFRQHPLQFFKNMLVKSIQFWHGYEFKRNLDLYFFKENVSRFMRLPFPGFGLIAPLGLLGMFLSRKSDRKVWLLQAFIFSYSLSVVFFFVTSRYRLPVIPVLLIFSAFTLVHLVEMIRQRRISWPVVSVLGILVFLVNWDFAKLRPAPDAINASTAESWYFLGRAWGDQAQAEDRDAGFDRALALLEKAISVDSNFANPHILSANYLVTTAKQRLQQPSMAARTAQLAAAAAQLATAEKHLRRAAQIDSNLTTPVYNLCLLLYDLNIIDFNFHDQGSGRLADIIFKRAAEIDQLTDWLLCSPQYQKYSQFYKIKEKARLQLQEYQELLNSKKTPAVF